MNVAWFAPAPDDVIPALRHSDSIDHFDPIRAHEFVWRHFTNPFDATVFELGDTERYDFVWPYLFHYPGIVRLRATSLQHSRSAWLTLHRLHHHLRTERAFSGWNFLRAPLLASRLVVVHDDLVLRELQEEFPGLHVRVVPMGAAAPAVRPPNGGVRFHVPGPRRDVVDRAAARAHDMGTSITVVPGMTDVRQEDVVIALEWPPTGGPPVEALRAMTGGLSTIVLETESVAAWPTLDAQTWQRRGYVDEAPIAISIDPRDEEHSLMLAMRRLAADAALRHSLGAAAGTWARGHADLETTAATWRRILREATHLEPLAAPADLPAHLLEDGTAKARAILGEIGVTVDFLE